MLSKWLSQLFNSKPSHAQLLINCLNDAGVQKSSSFPEIDESTIPCLAASRALLGFYNDNCPIRSSFKNVISRTEVGVENISLRTVEGCIASKSQMTSFKKMAQLPWLARKTADNKDNVETLADKVLNGRSDCVKYHNRNAHIYRQEWDGRIWFANDGGSHRTTSVWAIDHENKFDRMLNSDITEFTIDKNFKALCETHSIFIFQPATIIPLAYNIIDFRKAGFILAMENNTYLAGEKPDWCLIVPKNDPSYADIKSAAGEAFDFADWALNPNDYGHLDVNHSSAIKSSPSALSLA